MLTFVITFVISLDKLGNGRLPSWTEFSRQLIRMPGKEGVRVQMDGTCRMDSALTLTQVDEIRMVYTNWK